MPVHIVGYLDSVARRLHLEPVQSAEILDELQSHIEDSTHALEQDGRPADEAIASAINELGPMGRLVDMMYEVHSRGSWRHTALAVIPHLLLALTYAFHMWTNPVWVGLILTTAMVASLVGWRKGRPRWTYPWLGYSLMAPIVSWGLAMSAVGYGAWSVVTQGSLPLSIPIYIASFVYIAFSMWIVIRFLSKVAKPDWVMASLAILPVPFLAYWFFFFYNWGFALKENAAQLRHVDSSAAIVFLIIAAATAVFFRIGRRIVRVALLLVTTPSLIILAWLSYHGGQGYLAVFIFAVVSLAVLLSPAFFNRRDSREELADAGSADGIAHTEKRRSPPLYR